MPDIDKIIAYESGELDARGTLDLFSSLIKSGAAWTLQGSYGRAAMAFIEEGLINRAGEINFELVDERLGA